MNTLIANSIQQHLELVNLLNADLRHQIEKSSNLILDSLQQDGMIVWCGNGGSASDAEHLSAELLGRFQEDRKALKSVALSANSSTVTSIANDYGYEQLFARQIEGLCDSKDILVAISTSGNSKNVIAAVAKAKEKGVKTIGLLGNEGGALASKCDLSLIIPSDNTARIQEMHILIGHIICEIVDQAYSSV